MKSTPTAGDERERLACWVRLHAQAIRGLLFGLLRRDDLADDLLQETFRKAWQARDRYVDEGRERAYLLRIADRLAVDHVRRSKHQETTIDDQSWRSAEPAARDRPADQALLEAEDQNCLNEALQLLSEPQRRVLLLRYFGELEFAEIAATMECPLGTVLSHCHRGLAKLRQQLVETHP